ncbi:MAG: molybdenum cofactor synthesis domain protein [Candidatus Eremiobacteraeota bacterium]|nr:molybdenum cofactor synthesis domain protein [Candidatus Eremiobacteraeota bacterium]
MFLHDVPLETARARFDAALRDAGVFGARDAAVNEDDFDARDATETPAFGDAAERLALDDALDRVTARPVIARLSSPHYHACAMDGIAVVAARTRGARETAPLELAAEEAVVVDTGDPLPDGFDAVIPIEHVEPRADGRVAIRAAVAPFEHVRAIGEDVVASEVVVPAMRRLGAADLAACAAAGVAQVDVVRRPRVAVITTGDELVDVTTGAPEPGAILDSNAVLLRACVRSYGGEVVQSVRVCDDENAIADAVREAISAGDVVVVNAGSSAGRDDYTARVFAGFGNVVVHGVAIRPGHPLVLAVATRVRASAGGAVLSGSGRGVPLLGIPGYPVSAAICADLFLRPLLERLGRRDAAEPREIEVELTRKLFSPLGEDEYVRAVAARVDGRLVATPLRRGAGVITSLSRANVLLTVPRFSEGARAGTRVTARALRPLARIERTLLAVGSHDVALDLLAGRLAAEDIDLVSAHVGSIAGLVALRERSAHLAGTHVLDPDTGTYNDTAVRRYGPREPVALVRLAEREQGLLVARGNPLGIASLADVARTRARYINRQPDAGTRILFDTLLAREGIAAGTITGYERVEFSHLAVGQLVANGSADTGLAIRAAARAFGLDFVPIAWEPYDLALPVPALDEPRIARLIAILREPAFRAEVEALGGYDCAHGGDVRIVEPRTDAPDVHVAATARMASGDAPPVREDVGPALSMPHAGGRTKR